MHSDEEFFKRKSDAGLIEEKCDDKVRQRDSGLPKEVPNGDLSKVREQVRGEYADRLREAERLLAESLDSIAHQAEVFDKSQQEASQQVEDLTQAYEHLN